MEAQQYKLTNEVNQKESEAVDSDLGRVTVLEALAEETTSVSIDRSHQSTRDGSGVDYEDD